MKWSLDRQNTLRFTATVITLIGITLVSCASLVHFKNTVSHARHTQLILQQLEVVLSQVKDAETGQRGYLLTGKDGYLQPYRAALATLNQEIDRLSQLTADDLTQQQYIAELRVLVAAKLAELRQTIELRQTQGLQPALEVVETGRGRKIMQQIRRTVTDLKNEQQKLSYRQLQIEEEWGQWALWLTISGVSMELLLVTGTTLRLNQETQNLQRSQEELLHSEQRYRSLVTATSQIVWLTDSNGEISGLPTNWTKVTGQTEQEVKEQGWLSVVHPEERTEVEQQWQAAIAAKKLYEVECRFHTADGSYRNFSMRGVAIEENGQVREWVGVCTDITTRKQAERSLKESRDELERRVQERTRELTETNAALQTEVAERLEVARQLKQIATNLERSNQELEQFAYVASHDLQEPLRAVASYTQLLARKYQGHLDEKADKYIGYVVDGATRMQQLINDLLAYSRVGRQKLDLKLTDCNVVLKQVLNALQIVIAENDALITFDALPTIWVDPAKLAQLFQNLISNAVKYRDQATPTVHISANPQGKEWLFSVQDNGIGIDPQYAERIFVIFQRLHTRRDYTGTGIGLAICRKIVELHQGRIWVESQLGAGATFYFSLPSVGPNDDQFQGGAG